jgi:membrane protein
VAVTGAPAGRRRARVGKEHAVAWRDRAHKLWEFGREIAAEFGRDRLPVQAAALSYYTVFSLPPLLVIALAIASMVFGEEAARGEIERQFRGLIGDNGAAAIETMIDNASRPGEGRGLATWLGLVALGIGATTVFSQLQSALNTIWGVEARTKHGRIWALVRKRLLTFGMVVGIGFLLLVSLLVSAAVAAFGGLLRTWFPAPALVGVMAALDILISVAVITLLLAAIYTVLPDAKIRLRFVWLGAALTSALFVAGKWLIGVYLGRSAPGSAFGAAGSLAIILIWVYYSSLLMYCGAEFIQVYSRRRGVAFRPEEHAEKSPDEDAAAKATTA